MELDLKRENYVFYDTMARLYGVREETHEAIVPDARPDILRIAAAYGSAYLSSRTVNGEKAEVGGAIRATVLYVPETGGALEFIGVTIPFSYSFDIKASDNLGEAVLNCGAELQSVDARTINPRKILVRATVKISGKVIERIEFALCSGVGDAAKHGVHVLKNEMSAKLMCAAGQKSFVIVDELELGAGRPAAKELIRWRTEMQVGEYNVIGRKVVFKGKVAVNLLYRTFSSDIQTYRAELPYSQIIELDGLEDGAECVIRVLAEEVELALRPESEGRGLDLSAGATALCEAYVTKKLEAVSDLYSTSMKSATDLRPYSFSAARDRGRRSLTVREAIETGVPVKQVEDMEILFEPVTSTTIEAGIKLESAADLRVLYIGDDDTAYLAKKRVPLEITVDAGEGDSCFAELSADNMAFSAAAISGVEVRFDALFSTEVVSRRKIEAVAAARLEEYAETPVRPSVVLRCPDEGESMWAMAKRYNTTEADIRAANGLESGAVPSPKELLLIPKRR